MKRDAATERLGEYFARNSGDIACAYLFGSVARDAAGPGSDVDVAVLFRTAPPATLAGSGLRLEGELERTLGGPVDLVVLNRATVDLVHRMLRDGVLVYEADASARVRFEVRARNEWFDLEPYLDEYRQPAGGAMVDADLVHKKLGFIETCVRELREIAEPARLGHDGREERFIVHTLQLAIQAAIDTASHVVSAERLGEPTTNRSLFDLLERAGWLPDELAARLRDMAGFRNVVVHGYDIVDLAIVRDILAHRLDDLLAFCATVRERLEHE